MHKFQQDSPSLLSNWSANSEAVFLDKDEYTDYLQALQNDCSSLDQQSPFVIALVGFQEWLAEWVPGARINLPDCSLCDPTLGPFIDAICNLQVNHLRVCLIVVNELAESIPFPRAAIELPEFIADFYGLIQVGSFKENNFIASQEVPITICGFLHYQQLRQRDPLETLILRPDWHDLMPTDWFDVSPATFRHYLQGQTATLVPTDTSSSSLVSLLLHQPALEQSVIDYFTQHLLLTPLHLWEVFSWEQGKIILTCPELRIWWQDISQSCSQSKATVGAEAIARFQVVLQQLTQTTFNTWNWLTRHLGETLDEVSHRWQWTLRPPLVESFRGKVNSYQQLIAELQRQGIRVPAQANNAYLDFELAGYWLRLLVIPIPALSATSSHTQEWRLVTVLEAQPNCHLPPKIRLQIRDHTQILEDQQLKENSRGCLWSCVVGDYQERFWVTIQLESGLSLTLPPFTYEKSTV